MWIKYRIPLKPALFKAETYSSMIRLLDKGLFEILHEIILSRNPISRVRRPISGLLKQVLQIKKLC